jgi:WD40 repeat protein
VTCSTDLTIKLWDTANEYKNIRTLHGHDHSISTVRFTQDGERLVSASRDKTIRVWEVSSGYVFPFLLSSSLLLLPTLLAIGPSFPCWASASCSSGSSHPRYPQILPLPLAVGLHAGLGLIVDTASKPSPATQNGSEK